MWNTQNKTLDVYSARIIKPLDEEVLDAIKSKKIVVLEENSQVGGLGDSVLRYYANKGVKANVISLGAKDMFTEHGTIENQLTENGLTISELIKVFE